jgi:hypothetical protein
MAFYQKFQKKSNNEDLYPRLKILADKIINDEELSSRSKRKLIIQIKFCMKKLGTKY